MILLIFKILDNSAKSKPITNIVGDEYDSRGRCFIFVDHEGRAYKSWNAYLENNRLPKGILVVPMDGIYNATLGGSGEAQVNQLSSYAKIILQILV